jgi:hypothetical protein
MLKALRTGEEKVSEYGEIIIYQTEDGLTKINVNMQDENVWLSLDQMAELFRRDKSTISRHIKNVFEEGELARESTVAKFATTATDGKTYKVSGTKSFAGGGSISFVYQGD